MMRDPKTDPMPAPDPATPTVAAPAPMNFAAANINIGSMDLLIKLAAPLAKDKIVRIRIVDSLVRPAQRTN